MNKTDDSFSAVIKKLRKRRWMAVIVGIFIFGFLSMLTAHGKLQPHWFTFVLLSIAAGCWLALLSQFLSWIFFLRPRVKNISKKTMQTYPIKNAIKKTKQALAAFSISTGCLIFCFFLFLSQQPNNDGNLPSIGWGDIVGVSAFCIFISFFIFTLTPTVISSLRSRMIFKKPHSHNTPSSLNDFQENHHIFKTHVNDHKTPGYQLREDWDHDPMNPASPEYQSTYLHWNNSD